LAAHGGAAAMQGMPEAVHARGDDGPSTEELRAGVPTGEAREAGAGAKTARPGGPSRGGARAARGAPREPGEGVRMSRAGFGADPIGVTGQSTPNVGSSRAPVTRRLRPRRSRNPAGIRRNVGGPGPASRADFESEAPVMTIESRRKRAG